MRIIRRLGGSGEHKSAGGSAERPIVADNIPKPVCVVARALPRSPKGAAEFTGGHGDRTLAIKR